MEYFYSIVLGAVQAITEFLPISSSGHLIIVHQIIPSKSLDNLSFDVMLHLGTLVALGAYFWHDLVHLIRDFFWLIIKKQKTAYSQLAVFIIIATLPALIIGYFFGDLVEQKFRSVGWVCLMLTAVGILLIVFEKIGRKQKELLTMSAKDSLVIGLAQALAFFPGVSRSGISIIAGLGLGYNRQAAARFSFLMAIPVIFIAAVRKITQFSLSDSSANFVFIYILGAAVAAAIGYLTIKYLLKYLAGHSLVVFAVYRFILALVLLFFFILPS
jgi:undecaprenyl-diphosphatase